MKENKVFGKRGCLTSLHYFGFYNYLLDLGFSGIWI